MENEVRSCSMDFGCVTPEYVYRMWGGCVAIEEIANDMVKDDVRCYFYDPGPTLAEELR